MVIDWRISKWIVILYWIFFSVVDGAYLSANLVKIPEGGWFAVAITIAVALINFIWLTGMQAKERAVKAARPKAELVDVIASSLTLADDDLGSFFVSQAMAAPTSLASASFPRHATQSTSGLNGKAGSRIHSSSMPFSSATKRISSLTPFSIPANQESTIAVNPEAFPSLPSGNVMRLRSIRSGEGIKVDNLGSAPSGRQHQVLATRSRRLGTGLAPVSTTLPRHHHHVLTYVPSIFSGSPPVPTDGPMVPPHGNAEGGGGVKVELGSPEASSAHLPPQAAQNQAPYSKGGPVAEAFEGSDDDKNVKLHVSPSLASHVPTDFITEQCVGVATLRGIGIYYTDQGQGIPPVMWHFLKNIEGLHQFVILLQVRVMPIPFLEPGERLVGVPMDSLPCFYRVVARYGYMEEINHGPEFIEELILHIADKLEKAASDDSNKGMNRAPGDANGLHQHTLQRITEVAGDQSPHDHAARISVDALLVLSIQAVAKSAGIDPAASQLALETLRSAYETSGVVYYTIGFNLRMRKMRFFVSQLGHDFWYDSLFKQLFINQYNESDFWSIPNDSLVELSIAIDI